MRKIYLCDSGFNCRSKYCLCICTSILISLPYCQNTWGVVMSTTSLSCHYAILKVYLLWTNTGLKCGYMTIVLWSLFVDLYFDRWIIPRTTVFQACIPSLQRFTDKVVYLQHGGGLLFCRQNGVTVTLCIKIFKMTTVIWASDLAVVTDAE